MERFDQLASKLPRDARIATFRAFDFNLFLDRPSYSLEMAVTREGAKDGLAMIVDRYDVDTVVLFPQTRLHGLNLERHLNQTARSPWRAGEARIWRLPARSRDLR